MKTAQVNRRIKDFLRDLSEAIQNGKAKKAGRK